LEWLWPGDGVSGFLNVFELDVGRVSHWFNVRNELDSAATTAAELAYGSNIYISCGVRGAIPPHGRGKAPSVSAIPGLWVDLDLQSDAHASANYPPTLEAAQRHVLDPLGLPPTVTVHSGHGLQYWWLFERPWIFESAKDRAAAASLSRRLQATLRSAAARQGWKLDNTSDLSRILRIPGTLNHKGGDARPVRILEADPGRRYSPTLIQRALPAQPEPERRRSGQARRATKAKRKSAACVKPQRGLTAQTSRLDSLILFTLGIPSAAIRDRHPDHGMARPDRRAVAPGLGD
jgi:hypothetical protein